MMGGLIGARKGLKARKAECMSREEKKTYGRDGISRKTNPSGNLARAGGRIPDEAADWQFEEQLFNHKGSRGWGPLLGESRMISTIS